MVEGRWGIEFLIFRHAYSGHLAVALSSYLVETEFVVGGYSPDAGEMTQESKFPKRAGHLLFDSFRLWALRFQS